MENEFIFLYFDLPSDDLGTEFDSKLKININHMESYQDLRNKLFVRSSYRSKKAVVERKLNKFPQSKLEININGKQIQDLDQDSNPKCKHGFENKRKMILNGKQMSQCSSLSNSNQLKLVNEKFQNDIGCLFNTTERKNELDHCKENSIEEFRIGNWTEKEQDIIFQEFSLNIFGWRKINQFLSGRNENSVKSYFHSAIRRIKKLKMIKFLRVMVCLPTFRNNSNHILL
jgi:hypothetical protein